MQKDESRQGVLTVAKLNFTIVKTILAIAREKLAIALNLRIKRRQEQFDPTHCSENPFSLQQKYAVLTY